MLHAALWLSSMLAMGLGNKKESTDYQDLDQNCLMEYWRMRDDGNWKIGPDRYYYKRGLRHPGTWATGNKVCPKNFHGSQLAIPHSGDDVHFMRTYVSTEDSSVGKLVMTE